MSNLALTLKKVFIDNGRHRVGIWERDKEQIAARLNRYKLTIEEEEDGYEVGTVDFDKPSEIKDVIDGLNKALAWEGNNGIE